MTKPRLFIIELLRLDDEGDDLFEGCHLWKIPGPSDSHARYMYLRTRREFEEAIDLFDDSDYRYLHISCYGGKSGIELTFDDLSFGELGAETGASPRSLIRMFGPTGNPQARNLFTVISHRQRHAGLTLRVTALLH